MHNNNFIIFIKIIKLNKIKENNCIYNMNTIKKKFIISLSQHNINSGKYNDKLIDKLMDTYIDTREDDFFYDKIDIDSITVEPIMKYNIYKIFFNILCTCHIYKPVIGDVISAIYMGRSDENDSLLYFKHPKYKIDITIKYNSTYKDIFTIRNDMLYNVKIINIDSENDCDKIFVVGKFN